MNIIDEEIKNLVERRIPRSSGEERKGYEQRLADWQRRLLELVIFYV